MHVNLSIAVVRGPNHAIRRTNYEGTYGLVSYSATAV